MARNRGCFSPGLGGKSQRLSVPRGICALPLYSSTPFPTSFASLVIIDGLVAWGSEERDGLLLLLLLLLCSGGIFFDDGV
jgi:hypothetical protein